VWDVKSRQRLRIFPGGPSPDHGWPVFKWSHSESYFARITEFFFRPVWPNVKKRKQRPRLQRQQPLKGLRKPGQPTPRQQAP